MRLDFMRAVGVISILIAVVVGIVAIRSYLDDNEKEQRARGEMLVLRADSPLHSSYLDKIAQLDTEKRNDEILGLLAAVLFGWSLSILSRPHIGDENAKGGS